MLRRILLILICIFILIAPACAYRRPVPPEETPVPRQERSLEQSTPQPRTQEPEGGNTLPKSDKEAVEENINGFDISDDEEITRMAESLMMTQISTGVNQNEAAKLSEAKTRSPENDILLMYQTQLPAGITYAVKYTKYDLTYDYFVVTSEDKASIYQNPDPTDKVVCTAVNCEKLALHQKVTGKDLGGSDIWYKVSCKHDGSIVTGYIHESMGVTRTFQFEKMLNAINDLRRQIAAGKMNHVSNYKNVNGAPPAKGDSATDEYGIRIYQSAPGYLQADTNSDFRYVPDGMLVRILEESGDFYKVYVHSFDQELFIPKKYIDPDDALSQLTHVVVVDRNQQNQAAFELSGNEIRMVSYTLATTGLKGETSFETPLGTYRALEKKDRFQYLKDNSDEIAGYAPFATRFCGGAYIHGVPVAYEEKDGQLVDPGIQEYLHTIGTFPRSHMCVRNFTSHAEFIYNWMQTTSGAIIVIE
ncbi:MAG TPA: murein L,D-transpeptidase [Clostridiales bacterium]|nr:murein L,D-transpeptidase [Clostridiales bacterium]